VLLLACVVVRRCCCLPMLLPWRFRFTNNQNIHFIAQLLNSSSTQVLNHTHHSQTLQFKYKSSNIHNFHDRFNKPRVMESRKAFIPSRLQVLDDAMADWLMLQLAHSSHHDHNDQSPYPLIHSF
jgi:hypothetical protein